MIARLKRLLPLPLGVGAYLAYQALGSIPVNLIINYAFAWPSRHRDLIPVRGGSDSVVFDTLLTSCLLCALTVLVGSWFVRRDLRNGLTRGLTSAPRASALFKLLPRHTLARALVLGSAVAAPALLCAAAWVLASGRAHLSFAEFLRFKLTFAGVLGVLVTPVNAAYVLRDEPVEPA